MRKRESRLHGEVVHGAGSLRKVRVDRTGLRRPARGVEAEHRSDAGGLRRIEDDRADVGRQNELGVRPRPVSAAAGRDDGPDDAVRGGGRKGHARSSPVDHLQRKLEQRRLGDEIARAVPAAARERRPFSARQRLVLQRRRAAADGERRRARVVDVDVVGKEPQCRSGVRHLDREADRIAGRRRRDIRRQVPRRPRARDVAFVRVRHRDRGARVRPARARPRLTGIAARARIPVIARRPVRLGRVRAGARLRIARPREVALVGRRARDRAAARAGAGLAARRPGAGVAVVARGPVRLGRVRAGARRDAAGAS